MAQVTIGMPLYRNARTLAAALDSLLSQTVRNLRIVLSDDASPDDTWAVCEAYARRDPRVTAVRQPRNLGYRNFKYVLDRAETPYFMWAAGDDCWAPGFVAANLAALESDRTLVGSISRVRFERDGRPARLSGGTYALTGTVADNLARFLSRPSDNSRMYGLFRTDPLKRSFPAEIFHAWDYGLSAATLLHGRHHEVPEVLMTRDLTPSENYMALARKDNATALGRLFPVLAMTRWLLRDLGIPRDRRILAALAALNVDYHFLYTARHHPAYARLVEPLRRLWHRHVEWRLTTRAGAGRRDGDFAYRREA